MDFALLKNLRSPTYCSYSPFSIIAIFAAFFCPRLPALRDTCAGVRQGAEMGWDAEIERDREIVKRIIALLFTLAGLAERAAGRPCESLVLWMLRRAERVALDFISPPAPAIRGGASESIRLAASFRRLALILNAMLLRARWRSHDRRGLLRSQMAKPAMTALLAPFRAKGWRQPVEGRSQRLTC